MLTKAVVCTVEADGLVNVSPEGFCPRLEGGTSKPRNLDKDSVSVKGRNNASKYLIGLSRGVNGIIYKALSTEYIENTDEY